MSHLTFKLYLTFDIPEAYSEPSQILNMEIFEKNSSFWSIFRKSSILDADWVHILPLVFWTYQFFQHIYLSDKSDTENESDKLNHINLIM